MADLELHLIASDHEVLCARVRQVQAMGLDGWFGILPRHAPMVAALDVGLLRYAGAENEDIAFVAGGFLEVRDDVVQVLTPASERAEEVDYERARAAAERAKERIGKLRRGEDSRTDLVRAEFALRRALFRMQTARRGLGR